MLERLEARGVRAAEARADERIQALANQLRALLPDTIDVERSGEGVSLSGPGLSRRMVLDSGLRWTIAGLLK
ncbi:MAG TPA: hypothetical protein VMG08_11125 [Allosphingosinicella sp.]|nr:hypothetical protein [Allosphingosinicella sp.]